MEAEHRRWVENLVAACERVLTDRPGDASDPYLRPLLADVEELRDRLATELRAAG